MRYFIDTNIFLFMCGDTDELGWETKELLLDCENSFIISSESIREIAMLAKGGKIHFKGLRVFDDVKKILDAHNIEIRYVAEAHLKTLFNLNPAPRHSDPADLVIISQAIAEKLPLISSDTQFPNYSQQGLKAIFNQRPTTRPGRRPLRKNAGLSNTGA